MKRFKGVKVLFGSVIFFIAAILLVPQGVVLAQVTANPLSAQVPLSQDIQAQKLPQFKLCPDLKVSLTVIKGRGGLVTLKGMVTNVGKGDYNLVSDAQVIMNLAYPPQYSYAKTGVSDILLTKPFATLKKGASFPVNCTFQIPHFEGWVAAGVQGNAKRLFTLRVVKKDMSPFKPGEDCNPEDNSKFVEIAYREKQH